MTEVVFLTVEQVIGLHRHSIERYGGSHGLRDAGLLESAVLSPQQTFGGEYLYQDIESMAGALWHSLVMNHPFVDGNKRIGLRAADVFLLLNGFQIVGSKTELVDLTIRMTTGEVSREDVFEFLRSHIQPGP